MKAVNATFVRNHIAETWQLARNEPVAVENHGETEFVIVSYAEYKRMTAERAARQAGYARRLFEGVDALLATPIPGIEEYRPR
jgi:PHD/YefM family antitoxin component YafN of YafNO toxin-antitoxin module